MPRLAFCLIALALAATGALAVLPDDAHAARLGSCLAPG